MATDGDVTTVVVVSGIMGILFACFQFWKVSQTAVDPDSDQYKSEYRQLDDSNSASGSNRDEEAKRASQLFKIYGQITEGANAFLFAEYRICAVFLVVFGLLVFVLTAKGLAVSGTTFNWTAGGLSCVAFLVGGLTSILSGYIGMSVAVFANARTTINAAKNAEAGWTASFNCAFQAGGVMGFSLTAFGMLVCYVLCALYAKQYPYSNPVGRKNDTILFEVLSGFGLGGSCIAMFGRVGGGIYTKAADVGADLAGKVVLGLDEDDPRNAAVIADNVGDNVGDVAGMGSDLFGSFAEGTCAAFVVGAASIDLAKNWYSVMFPLVISALGLIVCLACSFLATDIMPVKKQEDVENVLKMQLASTSVVMTAVLYPLCNAFLPAKFSFWGSNPNAADYVCTPTDAFICIIAGLWAGCLIGFITEYYTSASYKPVQEVANSCKTGAATNIIYGLALGYKSLIAPIFLLAVTVYLGFTLCGMYGVALSSLGMLSTLATCLSIDVYGPVCDNAGGIAEMADYPDYVRDKTDALDAAGNTTAAIGKGFAIGSAALVALALFGAFVSRSGLEVINILRPVVFAFILLGAMIPYWFTAMTMKSVGAAAMEMVREVERQFAEIPGLKEGNAECDPAKCIDISTKASLSEMVAPGMLVILTPIIVGTFFGVEAVSGLLTGSITSGVQLAISQSNSGGAWDNAKKFVEAGNVMGPPLDAEGVSDKSKPDEVKGKGSAEHKAAVTGDTVGDPLKDTSGPAINIVMKLQAIIALVFASFFVSINQGHGVFNIKSIKYQAVSV
jgi:inorganic pyrophosphatase